MAAWVQLQRMVRRRLESFQRASRNRRSPLTRSSQSELSIHGPPVARAMGAARDCNAWKRSNEILLFGKPKCCSKETSIVPTTLTSHVRSPIPQTGHDIAESSGEGPVGASNTTKA